MYYNSVIPKLLVAWVTDDAAFVGRGMIGQNFKNVIKM